MWFAVVNILFAPFITYLWGTLIAEGHIFEKFGKWLNEGEYWYKKPLGRCLICFNIWISFICFFAPVEVVVFIGMIGISNYLIQKI
jgi:hypothetical protein